MAQKTPALQPRLKRIANAERLQRLVGKNRGAEVYLVGGAVRDLLLKRRLGDLDIVVRGIPLMKLRKLLAKAGEVNLVGKTFGVLKFRPRGSRTEIDVALPRTEHAFGTGGTRDVDVQYNPKLPLEKDLARRDFTINALAVNLATGELLDPTGGLSDLAGEQLRAVGNPADRFQEDLSRVLRGLRFAVELGFNIEEKTWRELKRLVPQTASTVVPRELVAKEFLKAFAADPLKTIDLWDISGAFRATMPEVLLMKGCPQPVEFHGEGDVWTHARLAVEMAGSERYKKVFDTPPTLETMVAIFLHDLGKPLTLKTPEQHGTDRVRFNGHDAAGARLARTILERLHISSYQGLVNPERVEWLIANHLIGLVAREMRPSTLERYFLSDRYRGEELLKLIWCDGAATTGSGGTHALVLRRRLRALAPKPQTPKPLIRGTDLLKLGLRPGPQVGKTLLVIRDAQLGRKIKTKIQAMTLARRLLAKR